MIRRSGHRAVAFADDNSIVDRAVAHRAGLGWYGKNANLLLPGAGSFFVLGSIITTTGYATTDTNIWPQLSKTILILLMFFGARFAWREYHLGKPARIWVPLALRPDLSKLPPVDWEELEAWITRQMGGNYGCDNPTSKA